jgi:hypothetical protein
MISRCRKKGSAQNTKKITGNEGNWKKTQGQTMNTVVKPSQERHRKMMMILGEGRRNAGMDRKGQLETLQKLINENGSDIR